MHKLEMMKMRCRYPLLCLLAVFSCAKQEEMTGDTEPKPQYTDNLVEMSVDASVGQTKAYMGEKGSEGYPFFWKETGESVVLMERASLVGSSAYTAIQHGLSSSRYVLSENGAVADFSFYVKELSNGDAFEYRFISPASCFTSAGQGGIMLEVPSVQTPAASSPDPEAVLLWNTATGFQTQPASMSFDSGFTHPLSYVKLTVRDLPLLADETVSSVSLAFEGKAVTGPLFMDWKGDYEAADGVRDFVSVQTSDVDTSGDFVLHFTAIPFDLATGDRITVNVLTSKSVISRVIEVPSEMKFPAGELTSFGVDMSSAERDIQTAVRLSSGEEYRLEEVSSGVYGLEIPYPSSGSLTFMYSGVEYGRLAASGSAMVGTLSDGTHLSRTFGRLAVGGDPIQMNPSDARTLIVRLDVSDEDGIPRYYMELPETEKNVIFHEDFSLMVWGGDYYTWEHGVTPTETADAVDGSEAAVKATDYTQTSFGNQPFDENNEEYIANRGLQGWTFAYCCERPYALQVGHANGAGSVTTPAFSALTESTDVNLHVDLARFGTNSSGVKISVEILGAGTFDKNACIGSRDAYTCNYGSYPAMTDVLLADYEVTFNADLTKLATSSNGQGKIMPRVYNNDAAFKPHTRLDLRILGADATTRIRIYGEASTARFTLFDIKVVKDEENAINGTVIDDASTLYGIVRDNTTGRPLSGVPMTDGYTYVTTDANGVYQMVAHENARCVYPSIPAEYEIPLAEDGQPQIYRYVTEGTSRYDFELTRRTESWDDFTIMAISDVHFYTKGDTQTDEEDKFKTWHVPDIVNYLSSASASGDISRNVIGISLGDNTSNYTEKLAHIKNDLYSLITYDGAALPIFHAIGNHDHRGDGLTDHECTGDFVNVFGPTDYSINIGKAHIIFMDNTMCIEAEQPKEYGKAMSFVRGITDAQWAWLQADVANVQDKENKLLIMCMHAPVFSGTYDHYGDIRGLMRTFGESHIMTGHLHKEIIRDFTDTWNGKTGRLSQEHNLLALGGSWDKGWKNKLSIDGTPMGYNVFNVGGNMLKEAFYNPVGQEDDYQFRIYKGSDKYENAKTINRDGVDVTYKFDWNSLFQTKYDDASMDVSGKFVVRVFAAGTRQKYWNVYLVDGSGNRTAMQWHEKEIHDQCALAYFYVKQGSTSADYAGTSAKNVWTVDVPAAYASDPEKAFSEGGYKVVAEYRSPGGKVFTYEGNKVQSTKKWGGLFTYEYYYNGFEY